VIRVATADDAAVVAEIYAPIVARTPISFEESAPNEGEMRARILKTVQTYPWLVWGAQNVAGYAYAGAYRTRPAYRWSVEVSAYVCEEARGRGIARSLYAALFRLLCAQGFCRAFAGITLPNAASVALHRRCGFEPVGVFREAGFKLGAWHDTQWWQRGLRRNGAVPEETTPFPLLEPALVEELLRPDGG